MARMIPPAVYTGCPSPGERELFERLKADPHTAGWIVLHSLDIAEHRRQISGEIDFLILVPRMGVLVLEVKAHRQIRCENGQWYYGTGQAPELKSPFRQAAEGMHSIRVKLKELRPELSCVLFWSAVLFPYVRFSTESAEWHPW